VLSGSWDKTINDWDLNTGQVKRKFETSGGQISAIEQRPLSTLPIPQDTETMPNSNGTFSSNNASRPLPNGISTNGAGSSTRTNQDQENSHEDAAGSPEDSLFGEKDSLFGDDKDPSGAPSGLAPFGDDDEDEFSRAIANGIQQADDDAQGDVEMMDMGGPVQPPQADPAPEPSTEPAAVAQAESIVNGVTDSQSSDLINGLPHSEETTTVVTNGTTGHAEQPSSSETTFFDASIDGTLRIWDRRQQNPVARITPPRAGRPTATSFMLVEETAPSTNTACTKASANLDARLSSPTSVEPLVPCAQCPTPNTLCGKFCRAHYPHSRLLLIYCSASYDILRLYDLREPETTKSAVPYLIVPGHRTGVISQLYIDPACTFMISTGGNRGWEGSTTEVLLGYEIGFGQ
jgi:transcriptional activator SPT8